MNKKGHKTKHRKKKPIASLLSNLNLGGHGVVMQIDVVFQGKTSSSEANCRDKQEKINWEQKSV
jgi:hypothetical protein